MQKETRRNRSSIKTGKFIAFLVSLILILCATVGGTLAFLIDDTSNNPLYNLFNPAKVKLAVMENTEIENTGDTEAWIRAAVVVSWQDSSGDNVYGQAPILGTDYSISYNLSDDLTVSHWKQGSDGFYYWSSPVAESGTTKKLIESYTLVGTAPDGYGLTIEVIASGIQSKPENVFNSEWSSSGFVVNTTGTSLVNNSGNG